MTLKIVLLVPFKALTGYNEPYHTYLMLTDV